MGGFTHTISLSFFESSSHGVRMVYALTSEMGPVTCVCADETMWHFFLDPLMTTSQTTPHLYHLPIYLLLLPSTILSSLPHLFIDILPLPRSCTSKFHAKDPWITHWSHTFVASKAIKDNNIPNVLYHITEHTTFPPLYVSALLFCCVNPVLVSFSCCWQTKHSAWTLHPHPLMPLIQHSFCIQSDCQTFPSLHFWAGLSLATILSFFFSFTHTQL